MIAVLVALVGCGPLTTPAQYDDEQRRAAERQKREAATEDESVCRRLNNPDTDCDRYGTALKGEFPSTPPARAPDAQLSEPVASVPLDAAYDAAPASADAPPDAPPALTLEDVPWWCSDSLAGGMSLCGRDEIDCAMMGTKMEDPRGACYWRERVACFTYLAVLAGKKRTWCAPSFASCKSTRALLARQKDDIKQIGACTATK
jgi:hypothetical protein